VQKFELAVSDIQKGAERFKILMSMVLSMSLSGFGALFKASKRIRGQRLEYLKFNGIAA
jgi:hypothetical protein